MSVGKKSGAPRFLERFASSFHYISSPNIQGGTDIDTRRGQFEIFGLDFTENETAVLNVFQDLKSEISEKSDQN